MNKRKKETLWYNKSKLTFPNLAQCSILQLCQQAITVIKMQSQTDLLRKSRKQNLQHLRDWDLLVCVSVCVVQVAFTLILFFLHNLLVHIAHFPLAIICWKKTSLLSLVSDLSHLFLPIFVWNIFNSLFIHYNLGSLELRVETEPILHLCCLLKSSLLLLLLQLHLLLQFPCHALSNNKLVLLLILFAHLTLA